MYKSQYHIFAPLIVFSTSNLCTLFHKQWGWTKSFTYGYSSFCILFSFCSGHFRWNKKYYMRLPMEHNAQSALPMEQNLRDRKVLFRICSVLTQLPRRTGNNNVPKREVRVFFARLSGNLAIHSALSDACHPISIIHNYDLYNFHGEPGIRREKLRNFSLSVNGI